MNGQPLLEVRGLTTLFHTRRGIVRAVDGVDLTLYPGEILGVVGESGCGKSATLLSILRLIPPPGRIVDGAIRFKGQDLLSLSYGQMRRIRGRAIAMIFQDPLSTLNPVFPVGEQIREALRVHGLIAAPHLPWPLDRALRAAERWRVLEIMQEVGISAPTDRYRAYPHQLSGGLQQRALIAIALACEPQLLLADEPTTALDVTIQAQILELMRYINQQRRTAIILVTHDLGVAAEFCHRIAVMYAGRIVEMGSVDQVVENPQHPYTRGLLECVPQINAQRQRITPIPGEVPDLAKLPVGCAFAPRCEFARESCEQGPIPFVQVGSAHLARCIRHTQYQRLPEWRWQDMVEAEVTHA